MHMSNLRRPGAGHESLALLARNENLTNNVLPALFWLTLRDLPSRAERNVGGCGYDRDASRDAFVPSAPRKGA